uniref:Uncharacterized protein n=1 Tax=Romanomermis culicivorax TaxID=13658 RepID=A0A915I4B6_ROMCU
MRPVKINSLAKDAPIVRDKRCVPPAPGMIANFVSTKPNLVLAVPTRMSQARANSRPPPNATPSKAAMTGTLKILIYKATLYV